MDFEKGNFSLTHLETHAKISVIQERIAFSPTMNVAFLSFYSLRSLRPLR